MGKGKTIKSWKELQPGMTLYFKTQFRTHEYELIDRHWPSRSIGIKHVSKTMGARRPKIQYLRIYGIDMSIDKGELRRSP